MYLADPVHCVLSLEGDEAEAPVPLGLLVHEHDGLLHLAELREVGADFVGRRLLTDAADEDLLGLVGLALALGRGVLGVDLLAVEAVRGDAEDAVDRVRRGEGDEAESAAPLQ